MSSPFEQNKTLARKADFDLSDGAAGVRRRSDDTHFLADNFVRDRLLGQRSQHRMATRHQNINAALAA
ncbi:hypothetical protein [Bradyrhizobium sp. LA2.1]|uniref:hypothetical protein n=1 Tax=Bradyrhizobium sp. LA2.1 TaxID=3156376 RepID=UPI00339B233C